MQRFFRNAGILAIAELVARAKGLFVIPLLTHHLGAVGYGAWSQVSVLVALVVPVLFLSTDGAVIRFLPGNAIEDQREEFAGWALVVTALSVASIPVIIAFRGRIGPLLFSNADHFDSLVVLAAMSVAVAVVIAVLRTWARVRDDANMLAAMTIGASIENLATIVLVLVRGWGSYELVLYGIWGDVALIAVIAPWLVARHGIAAPRFDSLPRFVRFGLPLVPAAYAMLGINAMDRLFIVHYESLGDVGPYSLAYSLGYLVIQLVVNPIWTMFPNAAAALYNEDRHDEVRRLFERTLGTTLVVTLPAIALTAVLGREIIAAVAPPSFAKAAPVIAIVMAGYLLHIVASYYEIYLHLNGRQGLGSVAIGIAVAANAALNFALIPTWGILGAAIATTVAFGVQTVATMAFARRFRSPTDGLDFVGRIALAACAAAGVAVVGRSVLHAPSLVVVGVLGVAGLAAYTAALVAVGAGSVSDARAALEAARRGRGAAVLETLPLEPPPSPVVD
jgi:O-antigen/teichoic acid export membrane protein